MPRVPARAHRRTEVWELGDVVPEVKPKGPTLVSYTLSCASLMHSSAGNECPRADTSGVEDTLGPPHPSHRHWDTQATGPA